MNIVNEQADARLVAHARELLVRAQQGRVTYTAFLTPREQLLLQRRLAGAREALLLLGGYAAAERRRMVFLPDYLSELEPTLRDELVMAEMVDALVALQIEGSGYRTLTHRDYLGAVLNLGISRDAIGDVAVVGEHTAILFCDRVMAAFLQENLSRVAQDAVRTAEVMLPPGFDGGRRFVAVQDTVASPRADAVVAALCNLSRERAQALFAAGAVEIDYEPEARPDRQLEADAVVTVRGHGKYIVRSVSEQTKKGRYRLVADRYV